MIPAAFELSTAKDIVKTSDSIDLMLKTSKLSFSGRSPSSDDFKTSAKKTKLVAIDLECETWPDLAYKFGALNSSLSTVVPMGWLADVSAGDHEGCGHGDSKVDVVVVAAEPAMLP